MLPPSHKDTKFLVPWCLRGKTKYTSKAIETPDTKKERPQMLAKNITSLPAKLKL